MHKKIHDAHMIEVIKSEKSILIIARNLNNMSDIISK